VHRHAGKVLRENKKKKKNVCLRFLCPTAHGIAAHLTLLHADNACRMNGQRLASVCSLLGRLHAERRNPAPRRARHVAPDASHPSHHQTKGRRRRRQRRTPTRPLRDARRINSAVERSPPARRSVATASRRGDELTRCRTARADVHS
jgi:hypothetical protein